LFRKGPVFSPEKSRKFNNYKSEFIIALCPLSFGNYERKIEIKDKKIFQDKKLTSPPKFCPGPKKIGNFFSWQCHFSQRDFLRAKNIFF